MKIEKSKDKYKYTLWPIIPALTDVTKQKDMSGFYRYLYRQTTGEVKTEVKPENTTDQEDQDIKADIKSKHSDEHSDRWYFFLHLAFSHIGFCLSDIFSKP